MTKDELRQKLIEVAEFKMPKLTPSDIKISKQKARGRGRPTSEKLYQDEHEEIFLDMFEGINPTHPAELVKVHIKPVDCEDCGHHCENGRQMEIKFYYEQARHVAHRRTRCLVCNKYRDPYTGEFTLPQGPASQVFLNWAAGEFTAKYKKPKEEIKKETAKEDSGVITKYPDTMNSNK
jgi:hypothetical protein